MKKSNVGSKVLLIIIICIILIFLSAFTHQSVLSLYIYPERKMRLFRAAEASAKKQNKPLLIVGDPYSGTVDKVFGPQYSCGSMCIDLTGCPKCEAGMKVNLDEVYEFKDLSDSVLMKLRANGPYVIFVSHTLDYVSNLTNAYSALAYLSESHQDIFIFYGNESWSSAVPFKYKQNYILETAPPTHSCMKYRSADIIKRLKNSRNARGEICPDFWSEEREEVDGHKNNINSNRFKNNNSHEEL